MVPNSVSSIVYLHLLSTAVPAAAAHLSRAQPEVGAGRGGDQQVRGGDTLGCRVSATMVAVWMLCEKYRFDLANLASVPTSLVEPPSIIFHVIFIFFRAEHPILYNLNAEENKL